MERWLIPAGLILIVLVVLFPILLVVYVALVLFVLSLVLFNLTSLPGPYLSLLEGGDGLRVNWLGTQVNDDAARVVITRPTGATMAIVPDRIARHPLGGKFTIYSAKIVGIEPGETCRYHIEVPREHGKPRIAWHGKSSRFTLPDPNFQAGSKATRIIALGDMQPHAIMPPLLQYLIIKKIQRFKPDLVIYLGDHTNTGNDVRSWRWYLRLIGVIGRNTPILGTPGNHDRMKKNAMVATSGGEAYDMFVNYPANGRYYGVDFRGIHFLSLDMQESLLPGTPQNDFVTRDIDERAGNSDMWLVIFSHATPYNTAIKPSNVPPYVVEMRTHVKPRIAPNNSIWLGGHEHAYQRFTVDGVHYITSAATSSFHHHDYFHEHMDLNVKRFHFLLINASSLEMHVQAIPVTGACIDDFIIENKKGRIIVDN